MIEFNTILCRYGEIGLKGNNRSVFEKSFTRNMKSLLRDVQDLRITRIRGRVWIKHKDESCFTKEECETVKKQMPKLFGLESYSIGIMFEPEMGKIYDIVKETSKSFISEKLENKSSVSFAIRVRRSNKAFPLTSKEAEIELAEAVSSNFTEEELTVNLDKPEVFVGCEIRNEFAFVYYDKLSGPGGLPTGSNSPVLSLISGGIDSPVAAYMTMKRGCALDFITFHSSPYTPQESIDKVVDLVEIINQYQRRGKLFLCNLAPFQKLVRDNCSERFRTILYRRAMMRISEKVALKIKRKALLTGEAIGQVASQTIDNMNVIDNSTDMLILRPLLGMDKLDIIDISYKIETFEISKLQVPDSCTVFAPASPATTSKIYRLEEEEAKIENYDTVLDEIIENIEIHKYQE